MIRISEMSEIGNSPAPIKKADMGMLFEIGKKLIRISPSVTAPFRELLNRA